MRKTFVSHLFCELDRMGINAFRDDLDLERGKSISPELVDVIKGSRSWSLGTTPPQAGAWTSS